MWYWSYLKKNTVINPWYNLAISNVLFFRFFADV